MKENLVTRRGWFLKAIESIAQTFPTEKDSLGIWYTPYETNRDGYTTNATGILWDCYNNKKSKLRKNGLLALSKRTQKTCTLSNTFVISDKVKKDLEELKTVAGPEEYISELWNGTFDARKNLLNEKKITVSEYFQQFHCLKSQVAINLINADFNRLFPDKGELFKKNWPITRNCLIEQLFLFKRINVEDKKWIQLLQSTPADEKFDPLIFWMLPYLVPTTAGTKRSAPSDSEGNRTKTGSAFLEKRKGFIVNEKSSLEIHRALTSTKQALKDIGFDQQPIPVFLGHLNNVQSFYVIFNDNVYNVNSVIEAYDLAVKIAFVFDCNYPPRAIGLWTFIQQCYFKIKTPQKKAVRANAVLVSLVNKVLENTN
ncbi:hypothetical protein HCN44_008744 [Aphidius gifuensis]|uniref:Uncharacterized protein n=1 Tax=Aphidius gifuensis TaxID=684658 RepID=A0A835CUC5_APHGI|nr:hypothetical protein HCN44_008744 [Aphidius gifuensis]